MIIQIGICQEDSITFSNEQILNQIEENLSTNSDENTDVPEEFLEEISELSQHEAFNLNALTYEVASQVLKLTDYQFYQLQLYIETYGPLVSVYELKAIDGFTTADMTHLMSLVQATLVPPKPEFFKNFFLRSKSNLLVRYGQTLEKAAGYDTTLENHYAGSPMKLCFLYHFNTQDKMSIKIAGEKDAGEQFFRGKQKKGFDFYAGSIHLKDIGIIKSAVIGDYRLNFGQGLVAGSSLLSGKGSGANGIRRFSTNIKAIAPTNESKFLRGGAISLGKTTFNGTAFAGQHIGGNGYVVGGDLLYRQALFKIGVRAVSVFQVDTDGKAATCTIFSSHKTRSVIVGTDYQVILHHQLLFGECAVNSTGKIGLIQGTLLTLSPITQIGILFRHYDPSFNSPIGNAFAASSPIQGETGCYLTGHGIISKCCEMDVYYDYYRNTCLTYRTDIPSSGMDLGASIQYILNRDTKLIIKYLYKNKEQNSSNGIYYRTIDEFNRHKLRTVITFLPFKYIKLTTELDGIMNVNHTQHQTNKGILLFQDVDWDLPKWKASAHIRIAYFDTDRYEERLYAYENDVYYAFTIGSYYYKGVRTYCVLKYSYGFVSIWLKLAQTYYFNKRIISSGINQIDKPHKTDLRIQLNIHF